MLTRAGLILVLLLGASFSPGQAQSNPVAPKRPRNIILLIGDGMGLTQITAATFEQGNFINLERFPYTGLQKCHSLNGLITDSGASATAMSTGQKTYNTAIGVDKDTQPLPTLLEIAESRGLATGVVVTSSITHATPAAFYAHVASRKMTEDIAEQLVSSGVDFFVGGGIKFFTNRKKDQRNLVEELEQKGFFVSDFSKHKLEELSPIHHKGFGYFTAWEEPLKWSEGRTYLPDASKMAAGFLQKRSEKGFVLVIEGAQIDWAGHANDARYLVDETLDFDRAVGAMLDFAQEDGETLIIVTADHETGGFAINPGSSKDTLLTSFTTTDHTASLVPVFAYGPGGELFQGIFDNTELYAKIRAALNW